VVHDGDRSPQFDRHWRRDRCSEEDVNRIVRMARCLRTGNRLLSLLNSDHYQSLNDEDKEEVARVALRWPLRNWPRLDPHTDARVRAVLSREARDLGLAFALHRGLRARAVACPCQVLRRSRKAKS